MSTPHFLVKKIEDLQRSRLIHYICPICNASFHWEGRLWANAKSRHLTGHQDESKSQETQQKIKRSRQSVRTGREAEPAKSQSSPKDNNPPRLTTNAQLASPTRLGRGFQISHYFDDKGSISNAQKNASRSSRSPPEYNADYVPYNPNPRKRSAARESEFEEPLADKGFSDRAGGARRAEASSGGPPGKDPEFWRENPLSHEAGLARRSASKRLFNSDTDNPSITSGRNKAREDPAARRIYDQRTHVFRSRHAPSGEKEDIQRQKISQNYDNEQINLEKNPSGIQGVRLSGSLPNLQDEDLEQDPEILLRPETRPISHDQLFLEVKGIYAGLFMVESKCIEVDSRQSKVALERDHSRPTKLSDEQWQALIALHKTLLQENRDPFRASQHHSANPALSKLPEHYSIPARISRHGINSVLRQRLPESRDHMLAFIYIAYSIIAFPYEIESSLESLSDLARYLVAIGDDIRVRAVWSGIARFGMASAEKDPNQGRLYHHLAILARHSSLQQQELRQSKIALQEKKITNLSRKPPRKEPISMRRDLPMIIEGRAITATYDTGADGDFISSQQASEFQIPIRKGKSDRKSFKLGNGNFMKAVGRIKASCAFAKDPMAGTMERWFYVIDKLAVPLIMGSPFLEETKTLSQFTHRLDERSPCTDNLPLVNLISSCKRSKNRLNAFINGRSTQVCADTGSELDLMAPAHAKAQRYQIDRRAECRKRVRLANNTIAETIGQVQVTLSLDNNKSDAGISRVFDILPGLPCGVLLGVDTLTETEAFTTYASSFVEIPSGSQDEPLMLHLITWVGRKVCAIERFFSRRRRRRLGGGTRDLLQPEPSAIKKRDNYLSDSLPESDSDDTLESLQQGQSRGSESPTAAFIDTPRLPDEGMCNTMRNAAPD